MGTLVPVNTGVPERISAETVMCLDITYGYSIKTNQSSFFPIARRAVIIVGKITAATARPPAFQKNLPF